MTGSFYTLFFWLPPTCLQLNPCRTTYHLLLQLCHLQTATGSNCAGQLLPHQAYGSLIAKDNHGNKVSSKLQRSGRFKRTISSPAVKLSIGLSLHFSLTPIFHGSWRITFFADNKDFLLILQSAASFSM